MSPLSPRPAARQRQLSNLKQGGNPAPAGNRRALQHGAYAAVAVENLEAKEREVFEALAADTPMRADDGGLPASHAVLVKLLADCLCRLESVAAHLRDRGILDRKGNLKPAVDVEGRLRREAADHAEALGMGPRAESKLGLDLARTRDLALEWAREAEAEDDDTIEGKAEDE